MDLNTDHDSKQGQKGYFREARYRPLRALKARAWNLDLLLPSIGCLLKHFMGQSDVVRMMF